MPTKYNSWSDVPVGTMVRFIGVSCEWLTHGQYYKFFGVSDWGKMWTITLIRGDSSQQLISSSVNFGLPDIPEEESKDYYKETLALYTKALADVNGSETLTYPEENIPTYVATKDFPWLKKWAVIIFSEGDFVISHPLPAYKDGWVPNEVIKWYLENHVEWFKRVN